MSARTRTVVGSLLMVFCVASSIRVLGQAVKTATITVGGAEQSPNGVFDNGNLTVDFNGYLETIRYGQYSTPAALASALGAMFSRDYYRFGLCAKAGSNSKPDLTCAQTGTNENQNPNVVTFQLKNGGSFGSLNVAGPTTSFNLTSSGFGSSVSTADTGIVMLQVAGTTIASTSYGDGSTATTIAQGLATAAKLNSSNSLVTVTSNGADLYLQANQPGAAGNYPYTVSATSSNPSAFPSSSFLSSPVTGTLTGGANQNTQGGTVYSYSVANGSNPGYDAAGNLTNISDTVMGTWQYGYDTLNRLTSGQLMNGSSTVQYTCWMYDSFGNRTGQAISPTPCANNPKLSIAAQYSAQNQILQASTAANGFVYDAAGNVTNDGASTYLYDADGRLCAVHGPQGMIGYQYDASGSRVGKGTITSMSCDLTANGYLPISEYVLDQDGGQMTELAVDENGAEVWQHTNVSANGTLIATYDTVGLHFYLNDALGTRRVQTDPAGVAEQFCQSLPFGDGLNCQQNLVAPTEHHFTGKERDTESGLDFFPARYYASALGRWTSPDPYDGSMDLGNPQSLNRYSYVANRPLMMTDPSGQEACAAAFVVATETAPLGPAAVGIAAAGCVAELIGAGKLIDDIFGLFSKPKFHGSTTPRPNAHIWDEDEFPIHYGPNIAGALGLPSSGCEFGACGGSMGFQQGYTPGSDAYTSPTLRQSLLELLLGVDWTDPNGRLYGTHYCGQGGSGQYSTRNTALDRACARHDTCYTNSGVTYGDNFSVLLSFSKSTAIAGCNQALCDQAAQLSGEGPTRVRQFFTYGGGGFYGCRKRE